MGVAAKQDCVFDLYFGIDYHSHLGTRRGGMVVYDKEKGFESAGTVRLRRKSYRRKQMRRQKNGCRG